MSHNPPELDAATAMMLAADLLEQDGRYRFMETHVPRSLHDPACALGCIGFVLGMPGADVTDVAPRIGYANAGKFYRDMTRVDPGCWLVHATDAATGLRRLARERVS